MPRIRPDLTAHLHLHIVNGEWRGARLEWEEGFTDGTDTVSRWGARDISLVGIPQAAQDKLTAVFNALRQMRDDAEAEEAQQ